MRVLFVEISGGTGGSANSLMRVLSGLAVHGVECRVVCGTAGGRLSKLANLGVEYVEIFPQGVDDVDPLRMIGPLPVPTRYFFRFFRAVSRQIKAFNPDVVYCNNTIYSHAPGILAARLARRPVIIHLRDTVNLTTLERRLVPWVARFVTLSDAALAHYEQEGIPASRLVRIYNGIDLDDFDQRAVEGNKAGGTCRIIAAIGALVERKGHRVAVEALAKVDARHQDAALFLAGDGPLRNELRELAGQLCLNDRVRFAGYVRNTPAFLGQAALCVLPSLREGIPNAVYEAMAAGLPVVVSDLPGIREVVEDGVTGYVVPPGDVSELARALGRLLDDPERAWQMGRAARERLEQGAFSAKEEAREVAALIRELVR